MFPALRPVPMVMLLSVAVAGVGMGCSGAIQPEQGDGGRISGPSAPRPGAGGASGSSTPLPPGMSSVPGSPPMPRGAACRPAPQRLWRLTPSQVASSARALWGADARIENRLEPFTPKGLRFSNEAGHLTASEPYFAELFSVARDLGAEAVTKRAQLHPCLGAATPDDACVAQFIDSFGRRVLRRPLDAAEKQSHLAFFQAEAKGHDRLTAIRQVVRRFLLSPGFVYRSEVGVLGAGGALALTSHELASALSYLLIDGPPDADLVMAADSGALAKPAALETQAKRLLSSPTTAPGLVHFLTELARGHEAASVQRPDLASAATVLPAFPEETNRFVAQTLWQGPGKLESLLLGTQTFVNATLAKHYGMAVTPAGDSWTMAPMSGDRVGLLGLGSFLTGRSTISSRGVFIRDYLLCQETPPVPPNVDTNIVELLKKKQMAGVKVTRRDLRAQHVNDPACAGCHALLDPMGMPFDGFDDVGRARTMAEGDAVYRDGALVGSDVDGPVSGARALVEKLAKSQKVSACFVRQVYRYVHGRDEMEGDGCYLEALEKRFAASGGDVKQLVLDILLADNFSTRSPFAEEKQP